MGRRRIAVAKLKPSQIAQNVFVIWESVCRIQQDSEAFVVFSKSEMLPRAATFVAARDALFLPWKLKFPIVGERTVCAWPVLA